MAIGERIGPSTVVGEGDSWMTERRKGISATALVAMLGRNPWRYDAALGVYREIVEGLSSPPAGNSASWGKALEPFLLERLSLITGREYRHMGEVVIARDDKPHHRASLDAIALDADCNAEAKSTVSTIRHDYGAPYSGEVPDAVSVQVQWGMWCSGRAWCDVVVGWCDRRTEDYFHVPRNDHMIQALVDVADDFWANHVEPRVPPDPMKYAGAIQWPERHHYGRPKWKAAFHLVSDHYRSLHLAHIEAAQTEEEQRKARSALYMHDVAVAYHLATTTTGGEK